MFGVSIYKGIVSDFYSEDIQNKGLAKSSDNSSSNQICSLALPVFEQKVAAQPENKKEEMVFDSQKVFQELANQTKTLQIEFLDYKYTSCMFSDVLCPKQTAVQVGQPNSFYYFHANEIDLDGLKFVAAQFPYSHGIDLFWKCAMAKGNLIIDLAGFQDYEKGRLNPYVPGPQKYCTTGNNEYCIISPMVNYLEEAPCEGLEMATLYKYKLSQNGEEKEIVRLHFEGWPDRSGLNVDWLYQLVEYIQPYLGKTDVYPMIHCRAGIGRTCTLIVAAYLRKLIHQGTIQNKSQLSEMLKTAVLTIRQQRGPHSVQTPDQLQAIWNLSCRYLDEKKSS